MPHPPHRVEDDADDFPDIPTPISRPMSIRDAWELTTLAFQHADTLQSGSQFMVAKDHLEYHRRHTLVDVNPGGQIRGFAVAAPDRDLFGAQRGIAKIVLVPGYNRFETSYRLIRGLARQAMADGQNTIDLSIPEHDYVSRALVHSLQGAFRRSVRGGEGLFGPVNASLFTVGNLPHYFAHDSTYQKLLQSLSRRP